MQRGMSLLVVILVLTLSACSAPVGGPFARLQTGPTETFTIDEPLPTGGKDGNTKQGARVNPIQVQKFLKGVDYPASKEELLSTARQHGADEAVLATLERLPDRSYDGPNGVAKEIGSLA